MKVLILSQYFWPERAVKIVDVAIGLQQAGHEVEVLTGFPCYPAGKIFPGYRQQLFYREQFHGISVIRVPQFVDHSQSAVRRILYYITFACSAVLLGLGRVRKAEIMLVYQSAIPTGIAAWVISRIRGMPYILDVVDLWPESVVASGMLKNRLVLAIIDVVSRFVYRQADHINAITNGYRKRLVQKGVSDQRISVIHHWIPEQPTQVAPAAAATSLQQQLRGRFNVVYTGNIGPLQALEVVLDAAARLAGSHPEVQFVIIGDGIEQAHLRARLQSCHLSNVLLSGRRPAHEMRGYYDQADALLVHLRPSSMAEVSIPSKLISYLESARPILMGVAGEATDFVERYKCGVCFQPTDGESLAQAVVSMLKAPAEQHAAWRAAAAGAYQQHFKPQSQLAKMTQLLRDLGHKQAA